jgi:hypothetical protein
MHQDLSTAESTLCPPKEKEEQKEFLESNLRLKRIQ